MPSETKRTLWQTLARNHPLLAFERIGNESKFVHIKLSGVKALNDKYGQAFWDALGKSANNLFLRNMDRHATGAHSRMLAHQHSWAEFSLPKTGVISDTLFASKTVPEMIDEMLGENRAMITRVAHEKKVTISQIEADIRANFRLSVGEEMIDVRSTEGVKRMEELLAADYRAEMAAKRAVGTEPARLTTEMTEASGREVMEMEKKMFERYKGIRFKYDGVQYPAVTEIAGQIIVHPKLL